MLALLDSTRDECDQITGQARRDAAAIMADARARAAVIGEHGGRRAQAARDEAARRVTDAAAADAAVMVANAQQEAARIRAQAGQRMPVLVNHAVGKLRRALLATDQITEDR